MLLALTLPPSTWHALQATIRLGIRRHHASALGNRYFFALSSLGVSWLLNETRRRERGSFGDIPYIRQGSKLSANGDQFNASVARPVEVDGKVVVPAGTEALGKVVEAVPQGRFKGAAVLRLVLESVTVKGDAYDVKTSSVSRYLKGKGKRTATLIGGGAGGGALIGGLAGGGKGALIGAALGAGAGTAGAAYTGEKEIVLPAESTLSFKLTQPVTVKM